MRARHACAVRVCVARAHARARAQTVQAADAVIAICAVMLVDRVSYACSWIRRYVDMCVDMRQFTDGCTGYATRLRVMRRGLSEFACARRPVGYRQNAYGL